MPLLVVGKAGGWIPCIQLLLPHIEWYIGGLCQSRLRLLCQNTCSAARICDSHDHASTQKFLQHCKNSVQACTNRIRLQSADHLYWQADCFAGPCRERLDYLSKTLISRQGGPAQQQSALAIPIARCWSRSQCNLPTPKLGCPATSWSLTLSLPCLVLCGWHRRAVGFGCWRGRSARGQSARPPRRL